jgi:hypothetical protein
MFGNLAFRFVWLVSLEEGFGGWIFRYTFYLMCISIFVDVDNCDRFINSACQLFSILNTIYGHIRIVHINNISVHIQIRCVPECETSKLIWTLRLFNIEKFITLFVDLLELSTSADIVVHIQIRCVPMNSP